MNIVFEYNETSGAWDISGVSLRDLDSLEPIVAADTMQDILCDALRAYNRARVRCGWPVTHVFTIGEGSELQGMPAQ